MILKMKKLSVLLYHKEREKFLADLQNLGVVHLVENPEVTSEALQKFNGEIKLHEHVFTALKANRSATPASEDLTVTEIVARYQSLAANKEKIEQSIMSLTKEIEQREPWGEFDPRTIEKLKTAGIAIRFFEASVKKFATLPKDLPIEVINRTANRVYFMLVEYGTAGVVDCEEITLPAKSLSAAHAQLVDAKQKLAETLASINTLAGNSATLERTLNTLKNSHGFESASINLTEQVAGKLLQLTGWLPATAAKKVAGLLDGYAAWFEISDPAPGDDVPILLKNNWLARKFEPVLALLSLPSYYEIDPVPFFTPFLIIFISLCLGDVGYGALMLFAAVIGFFKAPRKFRGIFEIVMVIAGVTIVTGFILNSCFGQTIFAGPNIPRASAWLPTGAQWFSPLSPVEGEKGTLYPMMSFAIVLGMIQVFLAIVLRIVNTLRSSGFTAAIFPFSFIPIFAGFLVTATHLNLFDLNMQNFRVSSWRIGQWWLSTPLPVGWALLLGGTVLFFFFNNPAKKFFIRPLLGLWEAFNFLTGMLSSILSYLRLFALGLCGGLLGASFNNMAFMIISKDGVPDFANPMIVFSILILLVGHSLNLSLSLISAIIHPLRLTFVEFLFNNLGFSGGGKQYKPFVKLDQNKNL
jgi:V/A-type H+-transporting ATPase subunit I